ncbi:MAG: efflux RND transporter periplasmic adaptor subunit [Spirochaetales bacterium]|nr:MAG: efflux RND transporter periplasmic adaptor subunit [Spirochaetales bacterium]
MEDRRIRDRRHENRRKEDRKRRFRFVKYVLLILVLAFFGYVYLNFRNRQQEKAKEILPPVNIVKPEYGGIQRVFRVNGYIESETMVTILPKIAGTLMNLYVDMGSYVEQNQIVAQVDSEPYTLTMRQAEAAYLAAKSGFERMEQLLKAKATSQQSYDQAKSQYDAMNSQYELAKLNFEYTKITSPISGVVLQKHTTVGSLVAPQVPIITVGDLSNLIIKAKVPEQYYSFFLTNSGTMSITVEVPALENLRIGAYITAISPFISSESKTFETRCALAGDFSRVRPGMFINITFVMEERQGIFYLPFNTLVAGSQLWTVDPATFTAENLEFKPVYYNDDVFQIPEEYKDRYFIFEGQHFIRAGQRLRVLNAARYSLEVPGEAE